MTTSSLQSSALPVRDSTSPPLAAGVALDEFRALPAHGRFDYSAIDRRADFRWPGDVALYETPGNSACEHDEHKRIVALIERGEAAAAMRLMNHHLRDLERRIVLDRGGSPEALGAMLGLA